MKDVNFNYYLSPKEDVIKMLKSYLGVKRQQDEEIAQETEHRDKLIATVHDKTNQEIHNIQTSISKMQYKINLIDIELPKYKKELDKKLNKLLDSEDDLTKSITILLSTIIGIAIFFMFFNEDFTFIWCLLIPIVIILGRMLKASIVKEKHRKKFENLSSNEEDSKKESRKELCKKISELEKQIDDICIERENALKNIPDLKERINLVAKFNIPDSIIGYEEFIYNLLIQGRVTSFNEALDKVEEHKHRKYLEDIQHSQYLEAQSLRNDIDRELNNLDRELNNLGDKFNSNMKEVKDLAIKATSAARSAEEAAYSASYEASKAAKKASKAAEKASDAENAVYYARR